MAGRDLLLFVLTLVAAVGCGLIAGVFYAFSSFIMQALARLPPAAAIAAMRSINRVVLNPWFLGVFVGIAIRRDQDGGPPRINFDDHTHLASELAIAARVVAVDEQAGAPIRSRQARYS